MVAKYFTQAEKKFLYNSIVRLHKENGSFTQFEKSANTGQKNFLPSSTINVADYLIGVVWTVCRDSFSESLDSVEASIMASVIFIKLTDLLLETNVYGVLKRLSYEIVLNELSYIDTALGDMTVVDRSNITADLKKAINDCYESHKSLVNYTYHYIPLD